MECMERPRTSFKRGLTVSGLKSREVCARWSFNLVKTLNLEKKIVKSPESIDEKNQLTVLGKMT
jgi:hypothetical protein